MIFTFAILFLPLQSVSFKIACENLHKLLCFLHREGNENATNVDLQLSDVISQPFLIRKDRTARDRFRILTRRLPNSGQLFSPFRATVLNTSALSSALAFNTALHSGHAPRASLIASLITVLLT
jgi:hypothetical protein